MRRERSTPGFSPRVASSVARLVALALLLALPGRPAGQDDGEEGAAPPNVLLICVDDLRPELGVYGCEHVSSPNIDALGECGRVFRRHYVQAPTCGASRAAMLTGTYMGAGNGALFQRAKAMAEPPADVPPSLPDLFRDRGYTTVSVGKVSHHPGGRGGPDWDDDDVPEMPGAWDRHLMPSGPWRHPRGAMHGLSRGEIRVQAGDMAVLQATEGDDSLYPDGWITDEALRQLDALGEGAEGGTPFFLAVGLIRPHLPFGAPKRYLDRYEGVELPPIPHPEKPEGRTTWHGSGEFMKYDRGGRDPRSDAEFAEELRRHYAACVSYADAQVGRIVAALEDEGLADDTVIVLWGDHGWHLGEHAVWGKHTLFEESLLAPLIIVAPGMDKRGAASRAVVESVDLLPTLCELTGGQTPDGVVGSSLAPIVRDLAAPKEGVAVSYHGRHRTIRSETHRLIVHGDGYRELYDHRRDPGETHNVAGRQRDVAELLALLLESRRPR